MPVYSSSRSKSWAVAPTAAAASEARPRGVMMRTGTPRFPALPASTMSKGPTAKATKDDGSGWVSVNSTRRIPFGSSCSASTRVLASATWPRFTCSVRQRESEKLAPGRSDAGGETRAADAEDSLIHAQVLAIEPEERRAAIDIQVDRGDAAKGRLARDY